MQGKFLISNRVRVSTWIRIIWKCYDGGGRMAILTEKANHGGNPFRFADWNNIRSCTTSIPVESLDDVTRIDRFALFLTTVAKFSREQWIQFSHEKLIVWSVCLAGS